MRDAEGFLYKVDDETGFAYRVTECCQVAASIDDHAETYCKACFKTVSPMIGLDPVIAEGAA